MFWILIRLIHKGGGQMKHYLCHQKDPGKWQVGCAVPPHRPPSLGDILPSSLDAQYPRFLFCYNDTCVFLTRWGSCAMQVEQNGVTHALLVVDLQRMPGLSSKWLMLQIDVSQQVSWFDSWWWWLPRSSADRSMLVYCRFCCLLCYMVAVLI
jgi:hypothetical protein